MPDKRKCQISGGDKGNARYLVEIKEMPDIW